MKTILSPLACFPLPMNLSPGEMGQTLNNSLKSGGRGAEGRHRLIETLGAFLPLPQGEGRGEGKAGVGFIN